MADDFLALSDLVNINNSNLSGIEVSSLFDDAPVLRSLPAVIASNGHLHTYLDLTQNPVVGFRAMNNGREYDVSEESVREVTCKIMDASFSIDIAATQIWKGGTEELLAREAVRHLRAAMFMVEEQIFQGTVDGEATGFTGLCDKHSALSQAYTDGAGGSTGLTSVYLLRATPDEVAVVVGNNGMIEVGEAILQRVTATIAQPVGHLPMWFVPVSSWFGCQTGAIATSSYRLANLAASTYTLTDDLIYAGISAFPASRPPNMIVMNRRSLLQLQQSRTATNATGAPAPYPTEVEGIRIYVTDAIPNDETQVT